MRRRGTDDFRFRGQIACCVLALIALSLGPSAESLVCSLIRDAAAPGFLLNRRLVSLTESLDLARWPWTSETHAPPAVQQNPAHDLAKEQELRCLRAALALARRDLATFDRSLGPVPESSASASGAARLPARIVSPGVAAGGIVLGSGSSAGVLPNQIAVEPSLLPGPETRDAPLSDVSNATVLAGAAVVGRTGEVGGWTATLVPVTDPAFRAHVQIVTVTRDGTAFGDEGILEGDGRGGCRVRYVPSTSAVAVGDHVYSRDPSGRIPQPLYYGRVERAELPDGAPHWTIHIRPAAEPAKLTHVHLLVPEQPRLPLTMNQQPAR